MEVYISKHGFFKRALSWLLSIAMLAGLSATVFAVGTPDDVADGRVFVSNVKTQLAPGAVEHKITTNNNTGKDQNIDFLCEVDLSGTDTIKVMACYAGYLTTDLAGDSTAIDWRMMTLPEQAARAQAYFDEHPEEKYISDGEPMTFVINKKDTDKVQVDTLYNLKTK